MKLFPNQTTFVSFGPLEIKWYAIMILTGAIVAYLIAKRNLKKKGYPMELADDLLFGVLLSGILGARLYYVLFYDLASYLASPLSILDFRQGGMAIHGGLIGGILFAYVYLKKKQLSFLYIADEVLYTVLIAQAIGRWGNFINQEAFGPIVDESFFNYLPTFIKNGMFIDGAYRMPMFLIEGIGNIIGLILIHFGLHETKNYKRGDLVYAYSIWYGIVRFFVESQRTDALMFFGLELKVAQLISVLLIVFGVAGFFGVFRKWFKNEPTILYDFDGTVMDTRGEIEHAMKDLLQKYPPQIEVTDELIASFVGPSLHETFDLLYGNDYDYDQIFNAYNDAKIPYRNLVKPMDDIKETLQQLKEKGYKVGIVSNKITYKIEETLSAQNMTHYFEVIVGSDFFEKPKPDKKGIEIAIKSLRGKFDNVIYIGDTHIDVETARNANAYAITYRYQDAQANLQIENHIELLTHLKEEKQWITSTIQ